MQLLVEQFEKFTAAVLQPATAPFSDDEFLALCAEYPDFRIETSAEGDVLIMPPAHPRTILFGKRGRAGRRIRPGCRTSGSRDWPTMPPYGT